MDAHVVYAVVKALPIKEQLALSNMLQKDMQAIDHPKKKTKPTITDGKAIEYLLQKVFNSNK